MNELLNQCLALSRNDRKYIIRELHRSIEAERRQEESDAFDRKVNRILNAMDVVLGSPNWRTEKQYIWARAIVAQAFKHQGYSQNSIAKILKKNHSTINYYQHRISDALQIKAGFGDVIRMYHELNELIS